MNFLGSQFLDKKPLLDFFRSAPPKMTSFEDLKTSDYLAVDFYLSKSCNRSCHYCTAWTKDMRNLTVDMDFLKQTLSYFSPFKTRICLLGGEPALIKNLDEVIYEIKKHKNFVVQVLSNSLVRKRYPWILEDPEIFYLEHLVLDFYEDRIEKLGKYEFLPENDKNNANLIIKTPNYYKYRDNFDSAPYAHKSTEFKGYNSRSPSFSAKEQSPELSRRICSRFPKVPVVDFEIKKIRHCSKRVDDGSRQFDITKKNVHAMMKFKLFEYEDYCKVCMDSIPKHPEAVASRIRKTL